MPGMQEATLNTLDGVFSWPIVMELWWKYCDGE
jgi:hypothetical protein